jgi:hypothetical protein
MSYLIMINDEQRTALKVLIVESAMSPQGRDPALEYWEDMLDGLPAQEAESPGCIHGFCL